MMMMMTMIEYQFVTSRSVFIIILEKKLDISFFFIYTTSAKSMKARLLRPLKYWNDVLE